MLQRDYFEQINQIKNGWHSLRAQFDTGSKDLVSLQKEGSHIAAEFKMIQSELTILFFVTITLNTS
jgi:hypothetical protein